jgi:hypothetical protein
VYQLGGLKVLADKVRRPGVASVLSVIFLVTIPCIVSFSALHNSEKDPGNSEKDPVYFPLHPNYSWTYEVDSQSHGKHYSLTYRAMGERFVDRVNRVCQIVDEDYGIERGGVRPVIYYYEDGFLNRLSGLKYVGQGIEFPFWTLSEEKQFLPVDWRRKSAWSNTILPYGNLPSAPRITQSHQGFDEREEIIVPAGYFRRCLRERRTPGTKAVHTESRCS